MENGTLIAVGEKFPLFQGGTEKMRFQDGALFEAMEDDGGFFFIIYLNRPHPEEISIVRSAPMSTRLIQEDNFVLPLIKFGHHNMIFELSFDPTKYQGNLDDTNFKVENGNISADNRVFQWLDKNNMLTVVLIDSSTGTVSALRQANFPKDFITFCTDAWARAFLELEYSSRYTQWYSKLQQQPLEILWERGVPVGTMGETYKLEELKYRSNAQNFR